MSAVRVTTARNVEAIRRCVRAGAGTSTGVIAATHSAPQAFVGVGQGAGLPTCAGIAAMTGIVAEEDISAHPRIADEAAAGATASVSAARNAKKA
jgi:hypothetical protein